MTLVFLVRHAHSTANDAHILSGRIAGVHLSPRGRVQSRSLAKRLGDLPVKALRSSPLERCEETIAPWLRRLEKRDTNPRLRLEFDEDLIEVDYGIWSGRKLRSLSREPLWRNVQARPSKVIFPEGEAMARMQRRGIQAVESALQIRGKGNIVLISHGDLIKSIIANALSMHLDDFQRIIVDPASVSVIDFSHATPRVLLLNDSRSRLDDGSFASRGKMALIGGGPGSASRRRAR